MSETILFDPQNTSIQIKDRILGSGNYTGSVDQFELLEPIANGQQYQITFRSGDGTSRKRGWIGHKNPKATELGHEFLARLFAALGVVEKLTLSNGNTLLAGQPVAFSVRPTGDYGVSQSGKQYERTEVKYVSSNLSGLPPYEEGVGWSQSGQGDNVDDSVAPF